MNCLTRQVQAVNKCSSASDATFRFIKLRKKEDYLDLQPDRLTAGLAASKLLGTAMAGASQLCKPGLPCWRSLFFSPFLSYSDMSIASLLLSNTRQRRLLALIP